MLRMPFDDAPFLSLDRISAKAMRQADRRRPWAMVTILILLQVALEARWGEPDAEDMP